MSGSDFNTSFDFNGDTSSFDFADSSFSIDDSVSFDTDVDFSLASDFSFDTPEFDFADVTLPTFDAETTFDFDSFEDATIFTTPSKALEDISFSSENTDLFAEGLSAFGGLDTDAKKPVVNNAPLYGSIAVSAIAAVAELIAGDFEADDIARIVSQGAQSYAAFKADPDLLGTTEGQIQAATQVLANTNLLGPEFNAVLLGVSKGIEQDWKEVDEIVLNGVNVLRASGVLGTEADPILKGIAAVAADGNTDTIETAIKSLVLAGTEGGILPNQVPGLLNLALDSNVLERLFGADDTPDETLGISDGNVQFNTNQTFTLDPAAGANFALDEDANITFTNGADLSDPDK
ncbi:hypothetical protein [uncultured Tateyamaria sp.]|uniref:hypothetical protein n=1 Tax=uncultured Tateyamaria sp. TaxID=455651 RepID=UPI002609257A|nr:hypothetical protein [uncultured Tateyamaria sp.]